MFFSYLDQFDRRELFSMWCETEGSLRDKSAPLAQKFMSLYANNQEDVRASIDDTAYTLSCKFSQLWKRFNRDEKRVYAEAVILQKPFVLPHTVLNQLPTSSKKGRKQLSFNDCSKSVKRLKTADLRAANSADTLAFASAMKLREEGRRTEASVVQIATQTSPKVASQMLNSYEKPIEPVVAYTPDEGLALLLDLGLTKAQWNKLRSGARARNVSLYPSYKKILLAKKKCYPESDSITVTEMDMEISFQGLLDHTSRRIVESNAVSLASFTDEELRDIKMVSKCGFDGTTGLSEFKQKFKDDDGTLFDGSLVVTSMVPIRATSNGKFLFQNPRPSSTRYCRPSHLQYAKETTELTLKEKRNIDKQIEELQPTIIHYEGRTLHIRHELLMTMVDGKVCNACTNTKSAQRCYICSATPAEFNNIEKMLLRPVNEETFQFGLSTLHAYIRFFEYFLHISYRMGIKKWSARNPGEKRKFKARKKAVQRKFKKQMGLIVDKARSRGAGNSNDGNTARRFFNDWEQSARITGINPTAIYRCKIILEVLASGYFPYK